MQICIFRYNGSLRFSNTILKTLIINAKLKVHLELQYERVVFKLKET